MHDMDVVKFSTETHISDDKEGREARMIIAGYAEMLIQAMKEHEPIGRICEIMDCLDGAVRKAVSGAIRANATRN